MPTDKGMLTAAVPYTISSADDLFLLLKKESVLERFGLARIGLFGSLARGEAFHDIDLLIEDDMDYKRLLELRRFLEEKTGLSIDILQREFAEPVILHRALKEVRYAAAS